MKTLFVTLAILTAVLLISCAAPTISMTVTRPAEINLKHYPRIAIGDIEGGAGDHAEDVLDHFTNQLVESEHFDVLDRQHLRSIMAEHNLNVSGVVNEETAAQLGEFIGAAALVFGRVASDDSDEKVTSEEYTQTDPDTKQKYKITRYTRTGEYTMTVNMKIIDIQTAKIIATKSFNTGYTASTKADGKQPAGIDYNNLYSLCLGNLSDQFMRWVAPYNVRVNAVYEVHKNLPELSAAKTQLSIGETAEALRLLTEATSKEGLEPKCKAMAHYDLGIIQMYTGDFDNALANLKTSMNLMPKKKIYLNAIATCKAEKEKAAKLQEQM